MVHEKSQNKPYAKKYPEQHIVEKVERRQQQQQQKINKFA